MIERRSLPLAATIEAAGGKPKIVGYAAVFNSLSEPLPLKKDDPNGRKCREIVLPGAFAESLRSRLDVLARYEHGEILGRVANGTLRLSEDSRGLRYEIDPPDTQFANDLMVLLRRRDVTAASFAFNVRTGGDTWRNDRGQTLRELRSVQLVDVSIVSRPAYTATDAALRSYDDWRQSGGVWRMKLEVAEAL